MSSENIVSVLPAHGMLTREGVERALGSLATKLDDVKGQIFETINRNFRDFVDAYGDGGEAKRELQAIQTDTGLLDDKIKSGELSALLSSVAEQRQAKAQLDVTTKALDMLRRVCAWQESVGAAQAAAERGEWGTAADRLSAATSALKEIAPGSGAAGTRCDPAIFAAMRDELRRQRAALVAELERAWEQSVTWQVPETAAAATLRIASGCQTLHGNTSVSFSVLVYAMHTMGLISSRLSALSLSLLRHLVQPLLKDPQLSPHVVQEATAFSTTLLRTDVMAKKSGRARQAARVDPTVALPNIQAVLQALLLPFQASDPHHHLSSAEVAALLSPHLIEGTNGLIETVISQCLAAAAATVSVDTEGYQALVAAASSLEIYLQQVSLLPPGSTPLSQCCASARIVRADQKRQELLSEARKLLLADGLRTVRVSADTERAGLLATPAVGEAEDVTLASAVFRLPAMHVTENVHALVQLAYSTLGEMKASDPEGATQLFYGTRDMFDLFRALTPVVLQKKEDVPAVLALFFNDCFYIAHHLVALGHQFRVSLPESMRSGASFVDMVPVFQELGECRFASLLERHRSALDEPLRMIAEGVQAPWQPGASLVKEEKAMAQIVLTLERLKSAWKDVLADEMYRLSLGLVIDHVLSALLAAIFSLDAIDGTNEQDAMLKSFVARFVGLVPALLSLSESDPRLAEVVPKLTKARQLSDLLDARLVAFSSLWESGSCALTAGEMHAVIVASFQDNEHRRQCLARIK